MKPLKDKLAELERYEIKKALGDCDGNVSLASDQLSMPLRTLWNRIRLYRIRLEDYRPSV